MVSTIIDFRPLAEPKEKIDFRPLAPEREEPTTLEEAFDFSKYKPPIDEPMGFDVPRPAEPGSAPIDRSLEQWRPPQFEAAEPKRRLLIPEEKVPLSEPDPLETIHRAVSPIVSVGQKYVSGRTLGADKLAWHILRKINPDLPQKPLNEAVQEISPYERTRLEGLVGGGAEFIGQIQSAAAVLKVLGWTSKAGLRILDRIRRNAPPWMTSGAIDAIVKGIEQEKSPEEIAISAGKEAAVRGAESVAFSAIGAILSKPFDYRATLKVSKQAPFLKTLRAKQKIQFGQAYREAGFVRAGKMTADEWAKRHAVKIDRIAKDLWQQVQPKMPLAKVPPARPKPTVEQPPAVPKKPIVTPPPTKPIVKPPAKPVAKVEGEIRKSIDQAFRKKDWVKLRSIQATLPKDSKLYDDIDHIIFVGEELKGKGIEALPPEEQAFVRDIQRIATQQPTPAKPVAKPEGKRTMKALHYTSYGKERDIKSYITYKGYKITHPHKGLYEILDAENNVVGQYAGPNGAKQAIDEGITDKRVEATPTPKLIGKPGFARVGTTKELKTTLDQMDLGFKKVLQVTRVEPAKIVGKKFGRETVAKVMTGIHETDVGRVEFREQKVAKFDTTAGKLADVFAKYPDKVLDDLMATRGHGLEGDARREQVKAFARLPKELKKKEVREAIQSIADKNYEYLRKVAGDDINYISDYFYGIYKSPKKVDKFLDYWRTTKRYTKEKKFPTYADARAYGLELRDPNPIHNLQSEYMAIAHLKGMQDIKQDLMDGGKGVYIWDKADAPIEADKVNDPIFNDVRVDPDLAKLINYLISTNKVSRVPALNALREVNNHLRTIKFIGSAFHLLNIAKQSVADSGYAGFYKPTARRGLTFGFRKNDPIFKTVQYRDYLRHGGGHRYSIESQAARAFQGRVAQLNKSGRLLVQVGGLPLKIPVGFVDWMFQKYIPKVKYAKYLDAVAAKAKKLGRPLTSGEKIEIIKEQQNFYGMMNERLFGRSGTVTSAMRFYFMSPGYAEGNYRTMVKAATQWGGKDAYNATRSRSNIINSWIISATLATIATAIMTGKWPKKPKTLDDMRDLFKIDTGKKDDKGRRIMIDMLTYDKDYWQIAFNILRLKPGKALELSVKRIGGMKAPMAEMIHDLASMAMGKGLYDWKGDEVYHLTDSFLQKAGKVVVHEIKRVEPISVSVFRQSKRRKIDTVVAAMETLAGLRPSYSEADYRNKKLQNKMYSLAGQKKELSWLIAEADDPIGLVRGYNKTVNTILDSPIMPEEMRKYWGPKLLVNEAKVHLWVRFPVKKMTTVQINEALYFNTYKRDYMRDDGKTYPAGYAHKGKEKRVAELRTELKRRRNK